MASPALVPPELDVDQELVEQYNRDMLEAAQEPLPDDDDAYVFVLMRLVVMGDTNTSDFSATCKRFNKSSSRRAKFTTYGLREGSGR